MFVGGLKALQTAAITLALPQFFITAIMAVSLIRWLRHDKQYGVSVARAVPANNSNQPPTEPGVAIP